MYLLKNKVATFAKVEKEEDMIQGAERAGGRGRGVQQKWGPSEFTKC